MDQFLNILRDPQWQFWGFVATVLIGIGGPLIAWLISRQRKELAWAVRSEAPIVKADEDISSRLKVLFDGTTVKDLTSVVIAVKNTGNVPISHTDYYRPVVVKNGGQARVLEARALRGKNVLQLAVEYTEREITLEKSLFNRGDLFLLSCLIEGYEPGALEVTAHIERAPIRRKSYAELASSGRFLSTILLSLLIALGGAAFMILSWEGQYSDLPTNTPSTLSLVELLTLGIPFVLLGVLVGVLANYFFDFFTGARQSERDN